MAESGLDSAALRRRAAASARRELALSPERLADLIGAIYDCALDPNLWEPTLDTINREFSFANSVLGVMPLRKGAHTINVSVGFDPEWLGIVDDETYRADMVAIWGGAEHVQQFPLDEPMIASQGPGYPIHQSTRYFRDILEPRGMIDAAVITMAREPTLLGYVAFNRHRSVGVIGATEMNGLRLLGPHFRRAVTISNLFDMKAIQAATFTSTLDTMAVAVFLVDETLAIVHANAAAETMLSKGDPLRLEQGVLALPAREAGDALEAAVRQAANDEAALGQKGIGIPVRRADGDPCVIHVLPLEHGEIRRGLAGRARAAVFVAPASVPPRLPTDALTLLYDLTPAESRVLEMVCEGATQDRISDALGIARSTVKTHVLHVFEKTGTSRQIDLVKLAARLSLPV